MNVFSRTRLCPKCRAPGAAVEFHKAGRPVDGCEAQEHLHRTCLACGYKWCEAPADGSKEGLP